MTTWHEIEKDGLPDIGARVWIWREAWIGAPSMLVRYWESIKVWEDVEYKHHYPIEPTDQWTPIVPPDPPKPED